MKSIADKHRLLRRFTSWPFVLKFLKSEELTLTDPSNWEDKNDRFTIGLYKQNHGLKSVLASCFTGTKETFHHWKVFGSNRAGTCVVFQREALEKCLRLNKSIRFGLVKYRKIEDVRRQKANDCDLPFLKRIGFQDEREYRVLWESKKDEVEFHTLKIPLTCIEKIVFNPWLSRKLADTRKTWLQRIVRARCKNHTIAIGRSYLVNSSTWQKAVTESYQALPRAPTPTGKA